MPEQNKTTIVFLHGWGVNSSYLKPLADEMRRLFSGFSLVSLEIPGFKKKLKKPWVPDDYVAWLHKELSPYSNIVLLGHSNGGRIGLLYTNKYPELVSGLILIASAGIPRKKTLKQYIFWIIAKIGRFGLSFSVIKNLNSFARNLLYKMISNKDYYKADPFLRETMKKLLLVDIRPYLFALKQPSLLLWGDKDNSTPIENGYEMYNRLNFAELSVYQSCNHSLPKLKPKMLAFDIIKFLESHNL